MPKLRFTRTPTEAEGGPNNKFVEGGVYDLTGKSYRRWLDVGCAVETSDEVTVEEKTEEVKVEMATATSEMGRRATLSTAAETVEEDPLVNEKKFIRSAGRGLFNVYNEAGDKLNVNPMTRADAEKFSGL